MKLASHLRPMVQDFSAPLVILLLVNMPRKVKEDSFSFWGNATHEGQQDKVAESRLQHSSSLAAE